MPNGRKYPQPHNMKRYDPLLRESAHNALKHGMDPSRFLNGFYHSPEKRTKRSKKIPYEPDSGA